MRRGSRDNVLAGALVLGAIAAAVVVVVLLAGGFDSVTRKGYAVRFPFSTGVSGLKRGSVVELAGVRVGSVGSIDLRPATGEGEAYVHVTFRIDRRHDLFDDAEIELVKELLGGSSRLNITSLGTRDGGAFDPRDPPIGTAGGGIFDKFSAGGDGPMLDKVLGKDRAAAVDGFIATWKQTGQDISGATEVINPDWRAEVDRIVAFFADELPAKVDEIVAQFKIGGGTFEDVKALIAKNEPNITEAVESYRALGARLDEITARNEQNVDQIITDTRDTLSQAREVMARFDGGEGDPLVSISRRAERMLDEYTRLGEQANQIAAENRADMRRTVARLRLTADQALDTMLEVRRTPWRLLYRPDERETAYELLYDSARQYARAVSDLDSVSTSTAALVDAARAGQTTIDDATLTRVTGEIDEARKSFERAQDHFLDVLLSIQASE